MSISPPDAPTHAIHRRLHLALIALLAMTALGAALAVPARPAHAATAVTTSDLNLRVGYRPTSRVKLVMPEGAAVELLNRNQSPNGYWKVSYQGVRGYAHADYLDFSGGGGGGDDGGGSTGTATTTSALNLRSRASTSASVLLVLPSGATVTLTGQSSNGFLGVTYQGTSGWASMDYLSTGGGDGGGGGGNTGTATTTSDLNLRSRASTNSSVLLVMPSGATVQLTGQSSSGFLGVTYRGTSGWASAQYLDTGGGGGGGGGASTIIFPVQGGGWTVIQGYNGGTHQGTYQNALDLARVGGGTAGQTIVSPVDGTVVWSDPGSGGILIDMGNGYGVAMFHVTFDGDLGRGSSVSQGQAIGAISAPGGNGYAVTPHVELDVWDIASGRVSSPFTGANALSGNELPNDDSYNQYGGTVFYP